MIKFTQKLKRQDHLPVLNYCCLGCACSGWTTGGHLPACVTAVMPCWLSASTLVLLHSALNKAARQNPWKGREIISFFEKLSRNPLTLSGVKAEVLSMVYRSPQFGLPSNSDLIFNYCPLAFRHIYSPPIHEPLSLFKQFICAPAMDLFFPLPATFFFKTPKFSPPSQPLNFAQLSMAHRELLYHLV